VHALGGLPACPRRPNQQPCWLGSLQTQSNTPTQPSFLPGRRCASGASQDVPIINRIPVTPFNKRHANLVAGGANARIPNSWRDLQPPEVQPQGNEQPAAAAVVAPPDFPYDSTKDVLLLTRIESILPLFPASGSSFSAGIRVINFGINRSPPVTLQASGGWLFT
jgi:hypothetical protein